MICARKILCKISRVALYSPPPHQPRRRPARLSLRDTPGRPPLGAAPGSDTYARPLADIADPAPVEGAVVDAHSRLSAGLHARLPAATWSHPARAPATSDRPAELDGKAPPQRPTPTSRAAALVLCPRPVLASHLADNSSAHTRHTDNMPARLATCRNPPPALALLYTSATAHNADSAVARLRAPDHRRLSAPPCVGVSPAGPPRPLHPLSQRGPALPAARQAPQMSLSALLSLASPLVPYSCPASCCGFRSALPHLSLWPEFCHAPAATSQSAPCIWPKG